MIRFQVYTSLLMGLVIGGLGIVLMIRFGNKPPFEGATNFSGYQIGAVLVGYALIRLVRAYFLSRRRPEEDSND